MNRGYCGIGLHNPKNIINIGGVSRAAGCYEADFIAVDGHRVVIKSSADTQKYWRHHPIFQVEKLVNVIPHDCVPVAVDFLNDAVQLFNYQHPIRAFYVFGAEDGTLGKDITSWCRDKVYIPTKFCMNLAATVNVVLYDRMAKANP